MGWSRKAVLGMVQGLLQPAAAAQMQAPLPWLLSALVWNPQQPASPRARRLHGHQRHRGAGGAPWKVGQGAPLGPRRLIDGALRQHHRKEFEPCGDLNEKNLRGLMMLQ